MVPADAGAETGPVVSIYRELTDGLTRPLRVVELVYTAAEEFPGLVPTRAEIDAERQHRQKDKVGREIAQGDSSARSWPIRAAGDT